MRNKLTDIICVGKVSAIDAERCKVKVTFEDRANSVSPFLFVTVPFTSKDKLYYMPSIGERVIVMYNPDAPATGRILGSFYADNRLPPYPDANKFYINFEDCTLIEYDKKLNKLTINIEKGNETSIDVNTSADIKVKSSGKVKIDTAKEIDISCTKDVIVNTGANINITVTGSANIKVDGDTAVETKGKTNIVSGGDMTVESLQALTLRGMKSELVL